MRKFFFLSIPQLFKHFCTGYCRTPQSHLVLEKDHFQLLGRPLQSHKYLGLIVWQGGTKANSAEDKTLQFQLCAAASLRTE